MVATIENLGPKQPSRSGGPRPIGDSRPLVSGKPPGHAHEPKPRSAWTFTLLAALLDVTIAAAIPTAWYVFSRAHLEAEVELRAHLYAAEVLDAARTHPNSWNIARPIPPANLEVPQTTDADEPETVAEQRRIFAADGHLLIEDVTPNVPSTPLLAAQQPVMDGATRIATIEVARSMRSVIVLTVAVACGSTGLGFMMFMLLRIGPMRMLATANERASFLAAYDPLTGLPNRRLFQDRLQQALADVLRDGNRVALFYVDLDHFTNVNELLGNPAGDRVLRSVAERLRGCLRVGDTLARIGGDQFGIIQPILNRSEHAGLLGERLLAVMAPAIDIDDQAFPIGVSIGVAVSDIVVPSPADLLMKQADMALHQAKQEGRGRISFFAPDMNVKLRERHAMETELRLAIAGERLVVHYQPQIDLLNGRIVGAEALVRWNRPGYGMVPPDRFIGLAEDTGLIVPIGEWVLREACRRAATWPDHIAIAVNVSTVQLRKPGFCQVVIDTLRQSGLAPARLQLELTESILMRDTAETLATLQRLRNLGTKLVMDDFGTGYSSLGYLQKFRFDKIKIDRSFVSRMGDDANANAIVRAVVAMTEALSVRANAEGVETQAQADALRATGCAEAQGFFYSRPVPGEQFEALVLEPAVKAPASDVTSVAM